MPNFYFTYGTDGSQPFIGGWTEIEAPDGHTAVTLFRLYHPDKIKGILNCAWFYTQEKFEQTEMWQKGDNFGYRCHEKITMTRVINGRKGKEWIWDETTK